MQGRLTKSKKNVLQFLPKNWKVEYDRLKETKLDYIELFTTKFNDESPIWNENKSLLEKKISQTKLKKIIVCDNYAFKSSLIGDNYFKFFNKIISRLASFKNSTLIIPIEDILFKKENYKELLNVISHFIIKSKKNGVQLSFEVQVPLKTILKFKKDLNNRFFKITFDTGNIFLIENNNKSFLNYFNKTKNFVNHIHLKDRDLQGNNVVLGTGIVNFRMFLKKLKKINYKQNITFETNRGKNCLLTAKNNLKFVKKIIF